MLLVTNGKCYACQGVFSLTQMGKHLLKCTKILTDNETQSFILKIKGGRSSYWMFVKVNEDCTLGDIDSFLRNIWLECCGHLSHFIIDDVFYEKIKQDMFMEGEFKTMNVKMKDLLDHGMKFSYEYDYGSTTTLQLEVYSILNDISDKTIDLLARNNPFQYDCKSCGKMATLLCEMCGYYDNGIFCEDCSSGHTCEESDGDEPSFLPVVNSPRMGVCAYEG